jgi:superfamily II DNA or RNA helicase
MSTFEEVLLKLPDGNYQKGIAFESLVKWWLQSDPYWASELLLDSIQLWSESEFNNGRDIGIDLTAKDKLGNVWAIQAKNWNPDSTLPKSEIDKFLSTSNTTTFQKRLLVTTTRSFSNNARQALSLQEKPVVVVTYSELKESPVRWDLGLTPTALKPHPNKNLFPHQEKAVKEVVNGFKHSTRGQLIMACGSGKTFASLKIVERTNSESTLVLVPSLLLVQQTLKAWKQDSESHFLSLAVCSDDSVVNDSAIQSVSDLSIPVTTDPLEIAKFLGIKGKKIVFSTYQSSAQVAKALGKCNFKFDLVIADEAHKLAGKVDKDFGTLLQEGQIPSKNYLFMTATPRIYQESVVKLAEERGLVVSSMDDENVFGEVFHRYSFGEAIEDKVLTDYRVLVIGVDDPTISELISERELVSASEMNLDAQLLASHVGIAKAMQQYDINKLISFHSRISSAERFAELHPQVRMWLNDPVLNSIDLETYTISGKNSAETRKRIITKLESGDPATHKILTNARCLTEGVDVPTLDGIAFIDPRASQVDIVQAVGRAIRRGGHNKHFGYIVIPVFVEPDSDLDSIVNQSRFKPVWDVINALKSHDSRLVNSLETARLRVGRNRPLGAFDEHIVFDLPLKIDPEFAEKIYVDLVRKTTPTLSEVLGILEEYLLEHGDINIPHKYKTETGFWVAHWLTTFKRKYKNGEIQLEEDIKLKLESMPGWTWDRYDEKWMKNFGILKEYLTHSKTETDKPIEKLAVHNETNIGTWAEAQRSKYNFGKLENERIKLLESLPNWVWDSRQEWWDSSYALTKAYAEKYGTSQIPDEYVDESSGILLGKWVGKQRAFYKKEKLSAHRIALLEDLSDWTWDKVEAKWQEQFNELLKYLENGTFDAIKQNDPETKVLATWLNHQFDLHKKGKMPPDHISKLESLNGWVWGRKVEASFARLIDELTKYVDEYGEFPKHNYVTPDGFTLGLRFANHKYRIEKIPEERRKALRSIEGWEW